jgi:hypothetical protein
MFHFNAALSNGLQRETQNQQIGRFNCFDLKELRALDKAPSAPRAICP